MSARAAAAAWGTRGSCSVVCHVNNLLLRLGTLAASPHAADTRDSHDVCPQGPGGHKGRRGGPRRGVPALPRLGEMPKCHFRASQGTGRRRRLGGSPSPTPQAAPPAATGVHTCPGARHSPVRHGGGPGRLRGRGSGWRGGKMQHVCLPRMSTRPPSTRRAAAL